MRLLDTRKTRIDQWLSGQIHSGQYTELEIVTGFLYKRGWSALSAIDSQLSVKTISSVNVDKATKQVLDNEGTLPASDLISHEVRFINELTQHAKLFLLSGSSIGKPDIAVIGSSNLTGPGLGIGAKKNLELNYVVSDEDSIKEFSNWFDDLWSEALQPHQVELFVDESQDKAPAQTYFAQLLPGILSFSDIIVNLLQDKKSNSKDYALVATEPYQVDAVEQIDFRLQRYGCCFLSDDVGLGKTIMGSGVIKRTISRGLEIGNLTETLNTLVICPKQVQGQWATHISNVLTELSVEKAVETSELIQMIHIATYGQERSEVWSDVGDGIRTSNVKLVLIDEAHRLRNTTNFYRWLSEIDADLRRSGSKPKYLFLTATPINNSFMDLHNLFKLSLPPSFWAEAGIEGIHDFLRHLDSEFSEENESLLAGKLQQFSSALSKLMIRRDVNFLNSHYSPEDLARLKIPNVENDAELIRSENEKLGACAQEIGSYLERALFVPYRLSIAYEEMHATRVSDVQAHVSHVLRAHLSKSIQSSFHAGILSLENIIHRCQHIMDTGERSAIARLEEDFGQDSTDGQLSDDEIPLDNAIDSHRLDRMRAEAERDLEHLRAFASFLKSHQTACDKEKAEALMSLLDPDFPTLVFTEYRATAKSLIKHLKQQGINVFEGDPDLLESSQDLQNELLRLDPSLDSPLCDEKPNYDVYVLTDKYSEGKNFHKCRMIINYDLPWNPIRKTQRQGRIVRVGSLHDRVRICSVSYSHTDLSKYANPEEILREKLRKIASVFGKGNNKDLLDEGNKFISYFVRYNQAALGGNSKTKVDSLGIMDAENESTYFYTIWDRIKESGYMEEVREVINTWNQIRESRDKTFVVNDSRRAIFSTYNTSTDIGALHWYEVKDGTTSRLRLEEAFTLAVDDWKIIDRKNENSHHELSVNAVDRNVGKIIIQIKKIVAETRLLKNVRQEFANFLNQSSYRKPHEFFNSLKNQLSPLKGDKPRLSSAIEQILNTQDASSSRGDALWVVLCTEAYAKKDDLEESA